MGSVLYIHVDLAHVVLVILFRALKVGETVGKNGANIGGGVTNGDAALDVVLLVALQVTGDGTQVRGNLGAVLFLLHDLVAREEGKSVGVVGEGLENGKGALRVLGVVALPWVVGGEGLGDTGAVDVDDHVDTGSVEDTGASIVVEGGVEVVRADGVDTHNLHEGSITSALVLVAEGIVAGLEASRATGLVGHADNLELLASAGVVEVGSGELEGSDGADGGGTEGHESIFVLFGDID